MNTRIYVLVSGKVQGVFFRSSAKKRADELDLTGWVKNLPEGSVEMLAQGSSEKIEALLTHLCGPQGPGRVDKIEQEWRIPSEYYIEFRTIR